MNLISISDLTKEQIIEILDSADSFRKRRGITSEMIFKQKSLAMIFEKPSTRTRVSLEVAFRELGGHAL
ncbi:MAG: ornithine carbamoyltransferase, partial [Methanotrichaceae archaeon]|nr:ornithine carbamoyltransferase [Methanotrichaceae archaeon]